IFVPSLEAQDKEARHDRYAAIRNPCYYHDICGRGCRWAELAVPGGGVSGHASGHGAKDSCADRIGARDSATGPGLFPTPLRKKGPFYSALDMPLHALGT